MTTCAVTAASGQLGRLVVEELLARGAAPADVVAVVRDPAKVADLAARGVQVRRGDYSDAASLPGALAGVDRLLLVSGSEVGQRLPQHRAVIGAAGAAGVGFVGYTSLLHADTSPLALADEHRATEAVLRESGLPAAVLRNSWYTENYTGQLGTYVEHGAVLGAAGDGRISAATRADYAAAAAAALLAASTGVFELGGPSFTLAELAAAVSEVTGREVVHHDLSEADLAAALRGAGLPEGTAAFLASVDTGIAAGALETKSSDLADLAGRPLTPLVDAVRAAWETLEQQG